MQARGGANLVVFADHTPQQNPVCMDSNMSYFSWVINKNRSDLSIYMSVASDSDAVGKLRRLAFQNVLNQFQKTHIS